MTKVISMIIMLLVVIEVDGVENYTYVPSESESAVIMEAPESPTPQRRRRRRSRRRNTVKKTQKTATKTTKTTKSTKVNDVDEIDDFDEPIETVVKVQEPKVVHVRLDTLTADYTAQNGEVFSGKLGQYRLTIADMATVVLNGVDITDIPNKPSYLFAGITCEGDATIILAAGSTNKVMGGYENCPAIYVPANKTLTIKGKGELECSSQGWAAAIGGGKDLDCGNIIIEEGLIRAEGGKNAAAIGGGWFSNCGNIDIEPTVTSVTILKHQSGGLGIGAGKEGTCGIVTIAESVQVAEE